MPGTGEPESRPGRRSCRRGVAAIEFALIAPVLATALLGMIEFTFVYSAQSKVNWVAQSIADLICQSSNQSTTSLSNLGDAAEQILYPLPTDGNLTIQAVSVIKNSSNKYVVDPAWGSPKSLISSGQITTDSINYDNLMPHPMTGNSIIYVAVYYRLNSPTHLFQDQYLLNGTFVMKPRLVPKVGFTS